MFRPYSQDQLFLLPPALSDFIQEDHPAHLISDLVEGLDLRKLEARYGDMGQPPYAPRMMLKVILYGFTVGLFSARKLSRACRENLAFQYLAGLERPAFKTFIEFRQRHREDMQGVFLQTVQLAGEMGLALLARVALDGSKIQANTSKHKGMSYGRMQEEEKRLRADIEALLKQAEQTDTEEDQVFGAQSDGYSLSQELARREARLKKIEEAKAALEAREKKDHPEDPIDPKKQMSFADPEARCFTKKGDGTQYVYNAQAGVDMDTQVIVENHIEDCVHDAGAGVQALDQMKKTLGRSPDVLVTDTGYANQDTWDACQAEKVKPLCAPKREDDQPVAPTGDFRYDAQRRLVCGHGAVFEFDRWAPHGEEGCYRCIEHRSCRCGNTVGRRTKTGLWIKKSHLARMDFQRLLSQPEGQALYRQRKCTVEPVFGQIKSGMGFRRFFYRGRIKVSSEWNLVCTAFNIKKIAALIRAGRAPNPEKSCFLIRKRCCYAFQYFWGYCKHLFKSLRSTINLSVLSMTYGSRTLKYNYR